MPGLLNVLLAFGPSDSFINKEKNKSRLVHSVYLSLWNAALLVTAAHGRVVRPKAISREIIKQRKLSTKLRRLLYCVLYFRPPIHREGIFKLLRSPGIDSKESILPSLCNLAGPHRLF